MAINLMWYVEGELPHWENADKEYDEHPEKYEDLTLYDSEGKPYIEVDGIIVKMIEKDPFKSLEQIYLPEDFLWEHDTYDELYGLNTLSDENIMMLIGHQKFVRKIETPDKNPKTIEEYPQTDPDLPF